MRTGKCPKCSSTEIYYSKSRGVSAAQHIVRINIEPEKSMDIRSINLEHFLCHQCGYIETYALVNDPNFPQLDQNTNWKKL